MDKRKLVQEVRQFVEMKLLTQDIIRKFPPIGATDGKNPKDVEIIAKFFTPDAQASWYATEYDPRTGEMFGWADMGMGMGELGYFDFNEIKRLRGKMGLPVERDLYFKATLDDVMKGRKR